MVKIAPKNPKIIFVSRWNPNEVREVKLDKHGKIIDERKHAKNSSNTTNDLDTSRQQTVLIKLYPESNLKIEKINDFSQENIYSIDFSQSSQIPRTTDDINDLIKLPMEQNPEVFIPKNLPKSLTFLPLSNFQY